MLTIEVAIDRLLRIGKNVRRERGADVVNAHGPLRRVFRLVYLDLPACYDSRPLLRQQIVMQSIISEETR